MTLPFHMAEGFVPRQYQTADAEWLASQKAAYLALIQGMGKTPTLIMAAQMAAAERVLVVGPAMAVGVWEHHINWLDGALMRHWRVFSYDKIVRSKKIRDEIEAYDPDVLIIDEAHYLKSPKAKRTKTVLALVHSPGLRHIWFASGTPTPNDNSELYTIMKTVMPGKLRRDFNINSYWSWIDYFCTWEWRQFGQGPKHRRVVGSRNFDKLHKLLFEHPFMVQRKWEDIDEPIPDLIIEHIPLDGAPPELQRLTDDLDAAVTDAIKNGEKITVNEHIASLRRFVGVFKSEIVGNEVKADLENGAYDKVLLFYHHKEVGNKLQAILNEFGLVRIDGAVSTADRTKRVEQFQTDPHCRVMLGQMQAAGTAATMTAAHHVVFAELDWVPATIDQAIARARRIGQDKPVFVKLMCLTDTLDDLILDALARKRGDITRLELNPRGD